MTTSTPQPELANTSQPQHPEMQVDNVPIIVIGAGPVGLAAALLLAKAGHAVTVYESHEELEASSENSYPIGVNSRGQETLREIDPELLHALRDEGEIVEAFHIYNGDQRVARLESGKLIATTRAFLNNLLLQASEKNENIHYQPGHKLVGLDLNKRELYFETSGGETRTVDGSGARVLAADGVWSKARAALADQVSGFEPEITDWGVQFRVAYSQPGTHIPELDPEVHHIFTAKGIYTATLKNRVWGVVLTAIKGDDAEELILSEEASPENISAMQSYIAEYAPLAANLLTSEDCAAVFSRSPFSGAVVMCDHLAFDEWILLIGDSAHSVIPPTGEGVNSGLEDARLLALHTSAGTGTWFADYETDRLPDIEALGIYAKTLAENLNADESARSAANVMLRILDTAADKLSLPSARVEDRLFGPDSGLTPYREAIGPWIKQREALFPVLENVAKGIGALVQPLRSDADSDVAIQAAGVPELSKHSIVVVGGSGGTGRELVEQAIEMGHSVTVISRSGVHIPGAAAFTGDASDPDVVEPALEGADAVVVTVGGSKGKARARTQVTQAVVEAMKKSSVKRLVVQTSLGAGESAQQLPPLLRKITPIMLAKPLEDHNAQEDVVRDSGLEWTIIRPAGLTNSAGTGRWQILEQGKLGTLKGRIARADVASSLLQAVTDPAMIGKEYGVSSI